MPNGWSLSIRYIIYKTPKDARGNYRREDCTRSRGPTPGSFSGAKIGDACASINDPPIGWYDLQFVRNRVSVYISAHCGPNQDREALGPEIRRGIEATANVIVRKIDRVVKSTGSVSLINLPPIRKPEAIRRSGPAYPDRVTKKAFAARAPAQPSPIDGASSITPSVEDFEPSLTDRFYFPRRDKIVRLMELNPNIQMVNTVGGGMGHGPGYSLIRYIIYKTPEDAKANWSSEDLTRPYKCVDGSFSGQLIGDACKHVSEPGLAEYDLGFMRGCVSVYIAWTAKPEQGASTSTSLRQAALEETAKVIVNRIDGVVKAKGTIDMSNLPPVHLRPG